MAVVIDTNLWGKGTLDVKRLTAIATRLERSGIQLWVPQQVLLEWARHAADDAEAMAPLWKRAQRSGQLSGALPVSSDPVEIAEVFTSRIGAISNVRVLPIDGASAIAGIKDQILGTGPGTVRGGTRTGGVDSSWVRDAVTCAGGDVLELVFLTDNRKDVIATTEAMGINPDRVRTVSEQRLYSTLFSVTVADDRIVKLLAEYVLDLEPTDDDWPHSPPSSDWLEIWDFKLSVEAADGPYEFEIDDVQLGPGARLIGLRNVAVIDSTVEDGSQTFSATVEFDMVVHTSVILYGHSIDNDGAVLMGSDVVSNVLVTAPFAAEMDDLRIVEITPAGQAVGTSAEMRADDPDEALHLLADELGSLAGVTVDHDAIIEANTQLVGPSGVKVDLSRSDASVDDDGWVLRFEVEGRPDETVEIACGYDPDARVWAGRDSFDSRAPYYVYGPSGERGTEPYTGMRDVWRWLVGV